MATYNPLRIQQQKLAEQQAELERQIAALLAQEKAAALQRIRALMAEFNLTTADLMPKGKQTRAKAVRRASKASKAGYRDPASGSIWSGRGRRPGWVVQWLAQDRSLDDLAI